MTHSSTEFRRTNVLNGSWQFVTDPDDGGRDDDWNEPDAVWPDRTYDVEIPHAWQELEEHRDYTGTAWYRRTIDVEPRMDGERTLLRFGAVDYETTVWVNGNRVGGNRGGYLPFTVDITDTLVTGENTVVVEVVDPDDISEIPHGKQGEPWYHRVSGIWQDVTLETVPELRVEAVRATPDLDEGAVQIGVDVTGSEEDDGPIEHETVTATVTLLRDDESITKGMSAVDTDGSIVLTLTIDDPEYWTPETPALYDVVVELERDDAVIDRYEDYFGMRSIEARDGRLFLNGEPYYVRGALDQGLYPKTLYRPFEDDLFEREVKIAKELGFNLLRKHIKPAHPDFLEQADRQGLLVWEEPANPTVHTERSKREVHDQIHGLIERDYNRPSVVVWSLYNEEWGIGNPQGLDEETSLWEDEEKQAYLADLYKETLELDPTRMVCDNSGWAHVATDINDYHRYFVSPDRANAWREDLDSITAAPEENYGATVTDPEDAPLIISEFGTWGLCDVSAVEEFYDGRPPWFDHEFLTEGLKRPDGYSERFAKTTLPDVFGDVSTLATVWQRREFRSITDVIEQMRIHDDVAGYVITEFSDIEWEFNGILDYRREPKVFYDDFARINSDTFVYVDVDHHAVRVGETLTADIVVVNDTTDSIEGNLEWSVFDRTGTVSISLDGFGTERIVDAITLSVPDFDSVTVDELTVSGSGIPMNSESITAVPSPTSNMPLTVYTDDNRIAADLLAAGFDVADALRSAVDVAVLVNPDDDTRKYAENGGNVLLVPRADGQMTDETFFEYRSLPEDESWNLVASLYYRDDGVLEEFLNVVPGWELEGLYPYDVISDVTREDDVQVGYVEGWIANWSAAVLERECGNGRVAACTFRVTDVDQPVGETVLVTLVENLGTN